MTYPQTILTRRLRRAIMITLIISFLVSAPLIILYTAGYRYDLSRGRVEQTGVISIDAEPKDAEVYLNDIRMKKSLPMRLPNRAPGTYHLTIKKAGYQSWKKDITVESKQTTYIKQITLFKQTLPIELTAIGAETIMAMEPTPNGMFAAFIRQTQAGVYEIELFDATTGKTTPLLRSISFKLPQLEWSPYRHDLLVITEETAGQVIHLFKADNSEPIKTIRLLAAEPNLQYQWQKNALVPSLFLKRDKIINLVSALGERQINTVSSTDLWFVTEENRFLTAIENSHLITLKNADGNSRAYAANEPVKGIIEATEKYLLLKTNDGYLVMQLHNDEVITTNKINATEIHYNQATKEWLAWSPWELWSIYDDGTSSLLNRTSEKIKFVRPLDEFGVVLIATEKSLLAFNPGYYVTHELFSGGAIEQVAVNKKQRKIYFLGVVGQRRGVFELEY